MIHIAIPTEDSPEFDEWFSAWQRRYLGACEKLHRGLLESAMRRLAGHPPVPVQLDGDEVEALVIGIEQLRSKTTRLQALLLDADTK